MTRIFLMLAIAATCVCAHAEPVNLAHVADCIAAVESGSDDAAIGAAGERGRYQISHAVWRQHRGVESFAGAHDVAVSRVVALEHLAWLARTMQRRRVQPTVYHLALAWNAGLSAMLCGRVNSRQRDYARRVANLYQNR